MKNEARNVIVALSSLIFSISAALSVANQAGCFEDPPIECEQEPYDEWFEECLRKGPVRGFGNRPGMHRTHCHEDATNRFCWEVEDKEGDDD